LHQSLGYAKEQDQLASQNASKALSRIHHAEANAICNSNNEGECELDDHCEFDLASGGEDHMENKEECKVALAISNFISEKLANFLGPNSRKKIPR